MTENNDSKDPQERIDASFRHYRSAAVYTTSTVIVLSSAILGWVSSGTTIFKIDGFVGKIFYWIFGVIPLLIAVLAGVRVQYCIFKGYFKKAQEDYSKASNQDYSAGNPNVIFGSADKWMPWCFWLFCLGFFAHFVLFSVNLFFQTKIFQ